MRMTTTCMALALVTAIAPTSRHAQELTWQTDGEVAVVEGRGGKTLRFRTGTATLHGRDIQYDYTMVGWTVAELDVESFVAVMTATLKTDSCENADIRLYLEDERNTVHMYRDNQGDPVSKIVVSSAD